MKKKSENMETLGFLVLCSVMFSHCVQAQPSCRNNCGRQLGSCSCSSSCQYYGSCCYDYYSQPSCRNNCGRHLGSCSCSSSCRNYGNCCYDYYCQPSCRYNCGRHLGSCSCSSSCQYYGSCCNDYYSRPSCRNNCGRHLGSCSCSSSCRNYGNCCYDYYCQPSCRYNCGSHLGSCSCSSSCQYYGGSCCYDYYSQPSCRNNCGRHLGSCSCSSSCRNYGNCCYDYYCQPSCRYNCGSHLGSCSCSSSCRYYGSCCNDYYCNGDAQPLAGHPCGGSLSSSGSFASPGYPGHYQNNHYCVWQLSASTNHRIYLSITNLHNSLLKLVNYVVKKLLSAMTLEWMICCASRLENCCHCDWVAVYDGPSVNYPLLGKLCEGNNTWSSFQSSSRYLTVVFRTDGSVVDNGFNADFSSSLTPASGRVGCSADNMTIVIQKSYLNSVGYNGEDLYLDDPYCRPHISAYQVTFNFPVNNCGTSRTFENGTVVYRNALHAGLSNQSVITHQTPLKWNVVCRMDTTVQIMYVARAQDQSTIAGTGRFNGTMAFYTSSNFYYMVTQVPYVVTLNQYMYVQVSLSGRNSNLVLFLDTCVASPSRYDFNSKTYDLVRNGCPRDSSYYAYTSGTQSYARFRFRAFQFLRAHESVYLQCKVVICPATDYNSRCRRGCIGRKARALRASEDDHTLVLGPVTLQDPQSQEDKESAEEEVELKKSIDV
ncbi:Deleted in malignant brain tumors 1 protein [Merluccius polli]|uniref:Deleted in malignant brain tumors 1 protein n=1 Tax=Merluccius polli TaxID=89951 RepID=A0AA47MQS9_MERPO|nr:Deleted in malignant brain tumors 1 protein [Merluccius polli]